MLGHKTILNQFKKIEIIANIFPWQWKPVTDRKLENLLYVEIKNTLLYLGI